jgi:hypothetical protein
MTPAPGRSTTPGILNALFAPVIQAAKGAFVFGALGMAWAISSLLRCPTICLEQEGG